MVSLCLFSVCSIRFLIPKWNVLGYTHTRWNIWCRDTCNSICIYFFLCYRYDVPTIRCFVLYFSSIFKVVYLFFLSRVLIKKRFFLLKLLIPTIIFYYMFLYTLSLNSLKILVWQLLFQFIVQQSKQYSFESRWRRKCLLKS